MTETPDAFEIFLTAPPGLEPALLDEVAALPLAGATAAPGGVLAQGGWRDVWRANLRLRGAGRVLARVGGFRVAHLAQLDKRARRLPWPALLRPDVAVRVEATCARSRIYHAGAAAERVARAIRETAGVPAAGPAAPDALRVMARIVDDFCAISLDASGEPLHRRGSKQAVGKAPMRETLAALFLRQCGYGGEEPLVDPMCGSGTFVIEAAEVALGLAPGRARGFAFETLKTFDPAAWAEMRAAPVPRATPLRFHGFDRDAGAIAASRANAARAGVDGVCDFAEQPVSALRPPEGPPGLVMVNPPYGARLGDRTELRALYAALGRALRERFGGWRVGLVTSEPALARAAGLPFGPPGPPVPHGPLKVRLYVADLS